MLLAAMLGLFIGGDLLPVPLTPDVVALLGASVSLTIVRVGRLLPVERLLADLDWSTLIYFMAVFVLIGSLERTGVLATVALGLADLVGKDLFLSSLLLLVATALLSAVVPQHPPAGGPDAPAAGNMRAAGVRRTANPSVCSPDAGRDPRRQCHLDRSLGQPGGRRHRPP